MFGKSNAIQKWLIAEKHHANKNEIVGVSSYFPILSSLEGKLQYIPNIYVKASERRRGIGSSLLKNVMKVNL